MKDMKQVAVDGLIWSYQEIKGVGTPIVFLHGWGRSSRDWMAIANEISKKTGRVIYLIDLPGFGGTNLKNVQTIKEYSDLVVKLLEYLSLGKVEIVGHSLGGRVGVILASKYPSLVNKLILIGPAGVKPRSIKRVVLNKLARLARLLPDRVRELLGQLILDEDYLNQVELRKLYRVVVKDDLREYLAIIQQETWVIWGERDMILPLSLTKIYKRLLPHPKIRVVWEAGHDPHLTHERKLLRIMEEIWN